MKLTVKLRKNKRIIAAAVAIFLALIFIIGAAIPFFSM